MYNKYKSIFNNCNNTDIDIDFLKIKQPIKNSDKISFTNIPLEKDLDIERKNMYDGTDIQEIAAYRYDPYNPFRGNYIQQDIERPFSNHFDPRVGNGKLYLGGKNDNGIGWKTPKNRDYLSPNLPYVSDTTNEDIQSQDLRIEKRERRETYTEKKDNKDKKENDKNDKQHSKCGLGISGESVCGTEENLDPILDPLFNLREVCKQMILLEDHLFQKKRRCRDCIRKHTMAIEGFLEEAITLDLESKYYNLICDNLQVFKDTMTKINDCLKNKDLKDDDCVNAAQSIRKLRKNLCEVCH